MKSKPTRPALRVLPGGGQLPLWRASDDVVEAALPLARELRFVAEVVGPESAKVADDLIELLEAPRRPRRIA